MGDPAIPEWDWPQWRDNRDALYRTAQALRSAADDLEQAALAAIAEPDEALNHLRPAAHVVHDTAHVLETADQLFVEHTARLNDSEQGPEWLASRRHVEEVTSRLLPDS